MPLTPNQILEIQKIIELHHYAYVANTVGHDAIPEEVLADLEQKGLLNAESLDLIKQSYLYGQSLAKINDKKARLMSYNQFEEYIKKNPIPLTQMEQQAVEMAQVNAGQYCRGLGNTVEKDTGAILIEADQQLRIAIEDEIKTATALNRAKRESISQLRSDLGWRTQDWARDLQRIATTETITAVQQGQADYLSNKYGADSFVAKIPNPSACKHCLKLHIGEDGQPRIFKLSTLENNGTNVGRKAADWRVVVGAIHPNCICSLVRVPNGWGFDEEGDLIPGGKLGIRYTEPKELERSINSDFFKSFSKLSHIKFQGIPIAIETREGEKRTWIEADGSIGETYMSGAAYGYVKNTTSMDEEELDVFIGPYPKSPIVFVIEQRKPDNDLYDEQKCMLGFRNEEHARSVYNANYTNGNDFCLAIQHMEIDQFKRWCGFEVKKDWIKTELKKAMYIGPRGGKWADPQHTIPWEDKAKDNRKIAGKFANDLKTYIANKSDFEFNSQGGITIPANKFTDNLKLKSLVVLLVPKTQDSGMGYSGNTPVLVINALNKTHDSSDIFYNLSGPSTVHEVIHYLDKGKLKGKEVNPNNLKEYFNHPSEVNAYINEGLYSIERMLDKWKDNPRAMKMVVGDINDYKEFSKNVFKNDSHFDKEFVTQLTAENRKKLDKRLFKWWDDNHKDYSLKKSTILPMGSVSAHRSPGPNLGVNFYIPVPEKDKDKEGEGYGLEVDDLLSIDPVPTSLHTTRETYEFNNTIVPEHPLDISEDVQEAHKDARKDADKNKCTVEQEAKVGTAGKASTKTLKKGGPYIGPRGGKWADPKHTIPWEEEKPTKKEYKKPGSQLPQDVQDKLVELKIDKIPQASIPADNIRIDFEGDVDSKVVIAWKDTKGKWQSGYTPKFHENSAKKKWERINKFKKDAPTILENLGNRLETSEAGSTDHQGLTILSIIGETGLRPGSTKSVNSHGHYGISTLLKDHVTIENGKAVLSFVGKSGKDNKTIVQNPKTVKAIQYYLNNKEQGEHLFTPNSMKVVSKKVLPKGMKVKDFRTIRATTVAEKLISQVKDPPPLTGKTKEDKKLLAKALYETSKKVATILNNTPAIAKASYIHPKVFEKWAENIGASKELWA